MDRGGPTFMQLQPLDASVLSRNVMFDVSSRRPTDQSDFNTNASSFPPRIERPEGEKWP